MRTADELAALLDDTLPAEPHYTVRQNLAAILGFGAK